MAISPFSEIVGIDDGNAREGGVEFAVLGDAKELWRGDSLKKTDGPKPVNVSVAGVRRLTLRVKAPNAEQCDWVDAKLIRRAEAR